MWIRTRLGDLLNSDFIQQIYVSRPYVSRPSDTEQAALMAILSDSSEVVMGRYETSEAIDGDLARIMSALN